ncbi:hypothetical protein [Paraflavitalea speifideaquila]|uniref:hypothetical protein n=1 Tax=Paraflavitalea speifideaquila TaxID=3076558 RepID=UPI0028E9FAE0|nr:hypothetical protein [Paraflavitalea speifideiaquila]
MKINLERSTYLWMRLLQGEISLDERAELDAWIQQSKRNEEAAVALQNSDVLKEQLSGIAQINTRKAIVEAKLRERLFELPGAEVVQVDNRKAMSLWAKRIASAAAVVIVLFSTYWIINFRSRQPEIIDKTTIAEAPLPGGNKAVLVLANGKQIALDTIASEKITLQESTAILNARKGVITYEDQRGLKTKGIERNTLRTPVGGQYKLRLSDGTIIWLNAASSVTYPTSFSEKTDSSALLARCTWK